MKYCCHNTDVYCVKCKPELWNPSPGSAKAFTVAFLTNKILKAKEAYYSGSPIITDQEFDSLEGSLRAYDPLSPVLSKVGS